MGFTITVEACYIKGTVDTRLPTKEGGKAVFAFLMALGGYCELDENTGIREWRDWFNLLQAHYEQPLCEVFKPILDCVWGDGGGIGGDFLEDEYQWYLKRNSDPSMNEAEFRRFIQEGQMRWSPIEAVITNVKYLIELFKTARLRNLEAVYVEVDTIPDFESMYETLAILNNFGYEDVRLNFS